MEKYESAHNRSVLQLPWNDCIPGVVIPEHFANEEFTKNSLHSDSEQPEKQVKQKPR